MKQALIVLGMHRSGTSSVAGTLALLGASAPKTLMPAHPDNQKGYWESAPLVELNDRILASAGSNWSDWRAFNSDWEAAAVATVFKRELGSLLEQEFGDSPLIVLKDPRISRLFPLWADALKTQGFGVHILMPLRSPLEIAASLSKRDGLSQPRALLIWLRHVLEAEQATRGQARCLFHWTDFIGDWRAQISKACAKLGISLPGRSDLIDSQVDQFLDVGLRRNVIDDRLPAQAYDWLTLTDHALDRLVKNPDDKEAQQALDEVRHAFNASADVYGAALAGLEVELAAQAQSASHRFNALAGESEARTHELTQNLLHANQALYEVEASRASERAGAEAAHAALEGTVASLQAHAAGLAGQVAELERQLHDVNVSFQTHHTAAAQRHEADRERMAALEASVRELQLAHESECERLVLTHSEVLAGLNGELDHLKSEHSALAARLKASPLASAMKIVAGRWPR